MAIQYNAFDYAQQLEAAGVPKAQAEVHATTLGHVISDCVAVPADLFALKGELTHQLGETETRLRCEIAQSEARLLTEIHSVESRLISKIEIGDAHLADRIDKLENALRVEMTYLKWMNGLTLAILAGFIVKSSLV